MVVDPKVEDMEAEVEADLVAEEAVAVATVEEEAVVQAGPTTPEVLADVTPTKNGQG